MKLILLKGKYGKVVCERRGDDELLEKRVAYAFQDQRDFRKAAAELGAGEAEFVGFVDRFQRDGAARAEYALAGQDDFRVSCRGRVQPDAGSTHHEDEDPVAALRKALAQAALPPEPLLSWEDRSRLCVLDVDYYGEPNWPGFFVSCLPRPVAAWASHGGGAHILYAAFDPFSADELAAVCGISVLGRYPAARVELKRGTRFPPAEVCWFAPDADVKAVTSWFGRKEATEEDVHDWLVEKGLEVGRRYPHTCCPVAPSDDASRDPVCVRDFGVFCHACNGRGVSRGHRIPGFYSFAMLVGSGLTTSLRLAVDSFAHWEHAKHIVFETVGLQGEVARLAYSGVLKLRHGDDPRVASVFGAGRNFVRFERRWGTLTGETYTKDVRPILARLPACQFVHSGKCDVDMERVARFEQPTDLTLYGYPALVPIFGVRIYSHRLPLRDPNAVPIVLHSRELAHPAMEPFRPRYVPKPERSEDESWGVLEKLFPGMSRALVRLLVAAKGCSEGEVGMPPMIFISGPTGSAKSSSVVLAAAICGDSNHSVVWSSNLERVRQALLESKDTGTFVTFNEILKEGANAGSSILQTMDFLLNLTPDSVSHKLYVGPVPLGGLPVCVWTDTEAPVELSRDAQLARRLVHVHLPRQVDWSSPLKEHGLNQIRNLRSADPRYASACNTVLSGVIDEFFSSPMTFEDIASSLGFSSFARSAEADEADDIFRRLFDAVCKAPGPAGMDARRWSGRGWKVVTRDQETDLSDLWRQVADESFCSSRRCSAVDWARVLGVDGPVQIEVRGHGQHKAAIRFVHYRTRKDYEVNDGLRVPGLRDAVGGEPLKGGCEGLSSGPYDASDVLGVLNGFECASLGTARAGPEGGL